METAAEHVAPSLGEIEAAAEALAGRIVATPVAALASDRIRAHLPPDSQVAIKLELFQHAGSFKARAALLHVDRLDAKARRRGVIAVSAGNHALAVSWAACRGGVSAKVVMPKTADPVRIAGCKALGGEVVLVDDVQALFPAMERIVEAEGRYAIHPFEGRITALGTATCGLELMRQLADLEAVVVPVGGGGLIAGMSTAIKQMAPELPRHRRRARGCGQHASKLRRRQPAGDREGRRRSPTASARRSPCPTRSRSRAPMSTSWCGSTTTR